MGDVRKLTPIAVLVVLAVLLALLFLREPPLTDPGAPRPPAPAPDTEPANGVLAPAPQEPAATAGTAAKAPPPEDTDLEIPAEPRRVRVLGPGDVPLEGVRIEVVGHEGPHPETGPDGWASLPPDLPPGEVRLWLKGRVSPTSQSLPGGGTTLRLPDLLPLEVEILDGVTGEKIWNASATCQGPSGKPLRLGWQNDRLVLPISPLRRGFEEHFTVELDLPPGYLLEGGGSTVSFRARISRLAEGVKVTVVAWPELEADVTVTEADGTPVEGVAVVPSIRGVRTKATAGPTDRFGRTTIRKVPAIPGEQIRAYVLLGARGALAEPVRILTPPVPVHLSARLPDRDNLHTVTGTRSGTIGIGGGAGGAIGVRGSRPGLALNTPRSRLEVQVLRRDGSPAEGVRVHVEGEAWKGRLTANAEGVARFLLTRGGPYRVRTEETGFLSPPPVMVEVDLGADARVVVREAEGRYLELSVLDHEGCPVYLAEVGVTAEGEVPYSHIKDGIQHLTLFTDDRGRLVLPHLPEGRLKIDIRFGSRRAQVPPGLAGTCEIRLPPPN